MYSVAPGRKAAELDQAIFPHFPEAFLGGVNIHRGIVGILKILAKQFDVEFRELGPFVAITAR